MITASEKQKRNLLRITEIADDGDIALLKQLTEVEDKFHDEISRISESLGQYASKNEVESLSSRIDGILGSMRISISSGNDSYLKYADSLKKSISSIYSEIESFKVSISEEIKNISSKNTDKISNIKVETIPPYDPSAIESKVSYIESKISMIPSMESFDSKISSLVSKSHDGFMATVFELEKKILNLEKENNRYKTWPTGGGSSGIKQVIAGSGISVDNSNLGYPVITATGGFINPMTTVGDIIIGGTAGAPTRLADVATGNALISGGIGSAPSWGKIGLTTHVSGILPIVNGGTNNSTAYTSGSVIYFDGTKLTQNNANLYWNPSTLALQVGSNATVNSNVKFLMRSGSAGVMGYPYEVGVFERNGDTKLGIYNSRPTAGGPSGASLTFGYTNLTDTSGYFPGLEFQFDGSTVPTESKGYFTFLQRSNPTGNVVAVPSRPLILVSSGRAGVMCDPFDTFVVQGGIHSTSYVNSFQEGEHLMDWGVANNARVAAIGDSSSPYPNYNVQLHSDSSDTLPVLNPIFITGDDTYFQASFGINTVPIKTFHVSGNGAESGMVVFDDTFSGNRMVFGNSGGTSDSDMNIWTNTGILNIGDGAVGASIKLWNGGSGVNAQIAADGSDTFFVADGNGYVNINLAGGGSALFYVNDRGLGDFNPSLAVYDNDAGAYGIALFSSNLRQFNIGCLTDNSGKSFSLDYANTQFNIYDPNSTFALNTRLSGGASDTSWINVLGGDLGIGTDNATEKVDVNGNIRLRSSIYDQTNSAGSSGDIFTNNGSGGAWKSPVAAGAAQVVTTVSLTNQSADIASANFTGANVAGLYRVSYSLEDTTADIAAGTVTLNIAYTDGAGSATSASAAQLLTGTGRTSGSIFIQLASGSISYSTTHTGLFGTAKYALYCAVERML